MERFVQALVAGGLALVAGLWATRLFDAASPAWLLGGLLALAGTVALTYGIWTEVEG